MNASMRFWRCQLRKTTAPQAAARAAIGPKKGARAAEAISHRAAVAARA